MSNDVKLLGINIDRSLEFDFHMLKVCCEANRKLTTLNSMFNLFNNVESQFKYCQLVLMFQGRHTQVNNKKTIRMRALRMIYEDSTSLFETLLEKNMSFPVHDRNI